MLVGSALAVRRLPFGQSVRMLLAWLLIFGALFLAFTLRDDFLALGRRALAELRGDQMIESKGGEVRIRRAADGHFWVDGAVNGRPVRFLVDSGATVTTLTRDTAARVGVAPSGDFGTLVATANGVVRVARGRAETIRIGPIARADLAVHISDTLGDTNVIGMNFLSTLDAWGVEGAVLRLKS